MRPALALSLALGLASLAAAEERNAEPARRAFVEIETARESVYLQEPFRLTVRIGFDPRFFETNVVPMFRRPMDVAARLLAPWLAELPGTEILAPGAGTGGGTYLTLALNDDVVAARRIEDRLVDGTAFTVVSVERTYLPVRVGEIRIDAARLRFAYGTEFEEDFVQGRRATDQREVSEVSEPLSIRVLPLPEEGRPPSFTGAVGRFRLAAEASPPPLTVGEGFRLTLRIQGQGNLGAFAAPTLEDLDGFHVLGRIDDRGRPVRTISYEVAPLRADVDRVPPIALHHFDPGPPSRYRVAETRPIPITVRPRTGGPVEVETGAGDDAPGAPGEAADSLRIVAIATAVLLAAGLGVLWRRRRGAARRRPDPTEERGRSAIEAFRAERDLAEALAAFLSVHLECPPAAVISPDLPARLEAAGVPRDLASRTAAQLEDLVAARYGGVSAADAAGATRSLIDGLSAAFRAR